MVTAINLTEVPAEDISIPSMSIKKGNSFHDTDITTKFRGIIAGLLLALLTLRQPSGFRSPTFLQAGCEKVLLLRRVLPEFARPLVQGMPGVRIVLQPKPHKSVNNNKTCTLAKL